MNAAIRRPASSYSATPPATCDSPRAWMGWPRPSLAVRLPKYVRRYGKVAFQHGRLGPLMQALEARFPAAQKDRTDGLKLLLPEGWIHVRASNTEPLLRVAAEAKSEQQVEKLYGDVLTLFG
jgi:phosphomannomutase